MSVRVRSFRNGFVSSFSEGGAASRSVLEHRHAAGPAGSTLVLCSPRDVPQSPGFRAGTVPWPLCSTQAGSQPTRCLEHPDKHRRPRRENGETVHEPGLPRLRRRADKRHQGTDAGRQNANPAEPAGRGAKPSQLEERDSVAETRGKQTKRAGRRQPRQRWHQGPIQSGKRATGTAIQKPCPVCCRYTG